MRIRMRIGAVLFLLLLVAPLLFSDCAVGSRHSFGESVASLLEDAFDFHAYWEELNHPESDPDSDSQSSAHACEGSQLYLDAACAQQCAQEANTTLQRPVERVSFGLSDLDASDASSVAPLPLSCHQCAEWPSERLENAVWGYVKRAREQSGAWGHTLDAGTGYSSLRFLAEDVNTKRWTAVTAQPSIYYYLLRHVARRSRATPEQAAFSASESESASSESGSASTASATDLSDSPSSLGNSVGASSVSSQICSAPYWDRLLLADWANQTLLSEERFDTILADYFLGSVDGFTPYAQPRFLRRFRDLLTTDGGGGVLILIGTEPYLVAAERFGALTADQQLLLSAFRLRDSCILYAGYSYQYREYPAAWVVDQLESMGGFEVEAVQHFPIVNGWSRARSALDLCRKKIRESLEGGPLRGIPTAAAEGFLATAERLAAKIAALQRARPAAKICLGMDYAVIARRQE
mmetsp:Transcript_8399/g.25993  ORF Transcript_8399/g.25993 Transcript_8399/m.25993 type:complete len:465 (-) Transcript_8399:76-1470(-)